MNKQNTFGVLYVCGTPIGNLGDVSARVLDTLKSVDYIACEDTRQTIKLLNYFSISKKLLSYHNHNEEQKSNDLIELLKSGNNLALVSDAGMPVISDPGFILVKKAIENNITVIPISGPSAFLLTLVVSGFEVEPFIYYGFLDRDKKKRENFFSDLETQAKTIVFYESPNKIVKTLKEILDISGNRNICIGREITKKFEEFFHGDLVTSVEYFSKNEPRGEFCVVLEERTIEKKINLDAMDQEIKDYLEKGYKKKDISKIISLKYGISSNDIYKKLID